MISRRVLPISPAPALHRRDLSMSHAFTRRQAASLLLSGAALAPFAGSALAQAPYLDIRRGSNFQPVQIAVTSFAGEQGPALSGIVTNNFKRSVFLQPLEPKS